MPPPSQWTVVVFFLMAGAVAIVQTQTYCTGYHQWWDGTNCQACKSSSCSIGTYRQTCNPSSTRDAECIPCTPPPSNAVHITGGLPYMQDYCMWACREGYYREGNMCISCTSTHANQCTPPLVPEYCSKGFNHKPKCMCPVNHYIDLANPSMGSCPPCLYSSCAQPDYETLVQCPGSTNVDVSRCVKNVAGISGAAAEAP